jgi:tRNA G46 methylase TrmB
MEAFKQYCLALMVFSDPWKKHRKDEQPIELMWTKN